MTGILLIESYELRLRQDSRGHQTLSWERGWLGIDMGTAVRRPQQVQRSITEPTEGRAGDTPWREWSPNPAWTHD